MQHIHNTRIDKFFFSWNNNAHMLSNVEPLGTEYKKILVEGLYSMETPSQASSRVPNQAPSWAPSGAHSWAPSRAPS